LIKYLFILNLVWALICYNQLNLYTNHLIFIMFIKKIIKIINIVFYCLCVRTRFIILNYVKYYYNVITNLYNNHLNIFKNLLYNINHHNNNKQQIYYILPYTTSRKF
jgi:hypothetical protein